MLAALLATLIVVLLLGLLGQAAMLWIGCKICRVSVSWRRTFLLVLGISATNLLLTGTWLALGGPARESLPESIGVLALQLVLFLAWLRWGLPVKLGKGILVGLAWLPLSVLFAVGLVLSIKATWMEAFIIPTGSMAETIIGYHKTATCPECGLAFPVNASIEANAQSDFRSPRVTDCICPNCRARVDLTKSPNSLDLQGGDRILATKGLLSSFFEPVRFQVVVFDHPFQKDRFGGVPLRYLDRLVGLPGETIAISGGKLYVLPPQQSPNYPQVTATPPEELAKHQHWGMEEEATKPMHPNHPEALDQFKKGHFQILRKPPEQVLALKRLVYDNDHQARDLKGKLPPCWAGDGWTNDDGTGFHTQDTKSGKAAWLRYRHLLRDSRRGDKDEPVLITDFMGYNTGNSAGLQGENWARDLILECEPTIEQPQGELTLELARGIDRFQAQFNLADGQCRLVQLRGKPAEKPEVKELTRVKTPVQKGTYRLRLSDVDERLLLWVNGKVVLPDGVVYEAPKDPSPKEWNDLEPASVGIKGTSAHVEHLKLWRDTYYTTGRPGAEVTGFDTARPSTWVNFQDLPLRTMYVQPDHFLCLGDNSSHSSDSRMWGLLPARNLLGRAILVYYPFARAGWIQ